MSWGESPPVPCNPIMWQPPHLRVRERLERASLRLQTTLVTIILIEAVTIAVEILH